MERTHRKVKISVLERAEMSFTRLNIKAICRVMTKAVQFRSLCELLLLTSNKGKVTSSHSDFEWAADLPSLRK